MTRPTGIAKQVTMIPSTMTSFVRSSANALRAIGQAPYCISSSSSNSTTSLQLGLHLSSYYQLRCAGHAKWQNIRGIKGANDLAKGKMISRYVMLVRRAIVSNGMQSDPKLNGKLADILSEANKMNVPKATLERAIVRATNIQVKPAFVEVQGKEGFTLIVRCETENTSVLRRDIKKLIKKFDANMLPDNTLINMFKSKGFIRASPETKDGRPVDEEFAEEAAIVANAEEVNLEEEPVDEDGAESKKVWMFTTDATTVDICKGELEKLGLNVLSNEVELVAYREVKFPIEVTEKVQQLVKVIREHEQVVDIYHNVDMSSQSS